MLTLNRYWLIFLILIITIVESNFINWMWRSWSFDDWVIVSLMISTIALAIPIALSFILMEQLKPKDK